MRRGQILQSGQPDIAMLICGISNNLKLPYVIIIGVTKTPTMVGNQYNIITDERGDEWYELGFMDCPPIAQVGDRPELGTVSESMLASLCSHPAFLQAAAARLQMAVRTNAK